MAKNDSKVDALKELSKYIKNGIIDDAVYQAYVDAAKAYGATQKEIEAAIQSGKKAIDAAQKTSQEAIQVIKNAEKIAMQSAELVSSVNKTQDIVEEKLAKLSRRVKKEQKNLAHAAEKGPVFEAIPSRYDKEAYEKKHKYLHIGETKYKTKQIAPGTEVDLNKIRKMSATQIAGVLTGNKFGDYSDEAIEAMEAELKTMTGKELTSEYLNLKKKIDEAKVAAKQIKEAGKRGTAFHKIAELLESGNLTIEQLTEAKIKELAQIYPEIQEGVIGKTDKSTSYNINRLRAMASDYEKLKKQAGLQGKPTTEKSLGFLAQIGDEIVEITGTFDSFFSQLGVLLDFKTTGTVDPKKIGIQLNILKKAIELHGGDVSSLQALHIPFRTGKKAMTSGSSVYDVAAVDDRTLQDWIEKAFKGVAAEVPTLLKSVLEPYSWEENGETRRSWMLNKIPIHKLPSMVRQGRVDEIVGMVQGLNPEDQKHFLNLLWSTKEYGEGKPAGGVESSKLYRSGKEWDKLRRALPSFYTGLKTATGVSEETFVDEEGNVSGATTVGGGFLSQWSKAYRLKYAQELEKNGEEAAQMAAQEIAEQFVKIVKDSVDEIGQDEVFGKLASLSFKDDIHNAFIDAVGQTLYGDDYEGFGVDQVGINERSKEENIARTVRSQKRAGERYYREQGALMRRLSQFEQGASQLDIKNPEQIIGFVRGIGSLRHIFQGALNEIDGTEMSQLNEAGLPEFIENSEYLLDRWYEFVQSIREKIKPIIEEMKDTARQTGDWSKVNSLKNTLDNLALTEDLSSLNVKTAHRFSWLYQAKDIYDEMLRTELPKGMTVEEYAKDRLTEKQYEQYLGSIQLRDIAEKSGGSFEDLINNFLQTSVDMLNSDLAKNIQDALFKIKEGAPELLSGRFYDIITEQTSIAGGESKKMEWWRNANAIERLRRGEVIGRWDPNVSQEISVSDELISYLDEKIRKIVDDVTKAGITAGAQASLELTKFLSQIPGISPGEVRRLYTGENVERLTAKYKLTPETEEGKKYAELLAKAKGVYAEKTAWTRESVTEALKDAPQKLSSVLELIDIYDRVKKIPTITVGSPLEKKVDSTGVDAQKMEIDADVVVIGEPEETSKPLSSLFQIDADKADISKFQKEASKLRRKQKKEGLSEEEKKRLEQLDDALSTVGTYVDAVSALEETEDAKISPISKPKKKTPKKVPSPAKKPTKKKKTPSPIGSVSDDDDILKVQATSAEVADLSKTKATSITTDYEGRTIGKTYKYIADKVFADYGPGGLQGWMEKARERGMEAAQAELIGILTKVPSYKKASGGLSKAGRTAFDEIMTDTFGKDYQPQQGVGAILNEVQGIHKDTTSIDSKIGSTSGGGSSAGGGGGDDEEPPRKRSKRKGKPDKKKEDEEKEGGAPASTPKQQKQDIRDYQQYINKIVSLESQIDKLQKQAALSTGKHRDAIYGTIDALNAEIGDLNRNNDALVKRVSTEQAATKASIDATAALKKQSNEQKNLVGVKGATSIWDMMANDINRAAMRIADFGIAAKAMNKIPQDIQKVIQYTKELNKVMTDIRIVTGATADEAKDMMRDYAEVARGLGTTLSEVGTSASEWMRQGYEGAQVLDLIQSSTKLATLGFMSQTEATKSLTAMMKSFNIAASDTIDIVDKLTKLDQVSAISAGELAEGISRVATTAQQAGLSIDQTAAAISVLTEQTQRDAGSMGDALRTIIVRFQNVKAGIYSNMDEASGESSELTENLSDVEKVLSKIGIRVRSSSYEFRNIYDVLDELAAKWDTLDSVTKSAIGGAFAGQRQREQFNILISQWERVKELTEESERSAGTADEKYTAYMDSMEAATKRLQNAWENFTQSIETSPVIKLMTDFATLLVENFDKLKYVVTAIMAANSVKIFDFLNPNNGESGGIKGLIANIPFFGRGTKTNNLLESIDKKVGDIRGDVKKGVSTKNGGLLSRFKAGFAERKELQKAAAGYNAKSARELATAEGVDFYSLSRAERQKYYEISKINAQKILKDQASMRVRAFGQTAAVAGISTLLTQLGSNKMTGAGTGGILDQIFGINKAIAGGSEQTIAETGSGKALRTGLSTAGAVAGAASALIPVIGPAIAPIVSSIGSAIGEGAASIISTIVHRSELEMKQRVADAKEQLKVLETISLTTEGGNQIMSEKFLDSSGYEKLNKYVESLSNDLKDLDASVSDKILRAVRDTGKTTAKTISQLADDILNSDAESRKEIQKALNIAIAEQSYNQLIASQEEEFNEINKTLQKGVSFNTNVAQESINLSGINKYGEYTDDGDVSRATEAALREIAELSVKETWTNMGTAREIESIKLFGNTPEESISNANKLRQIIEDIDFGKDQFGEAEIVTKMLTDYADAVQKSAEKTLQLNKELRDSQIQIAYLKSGISDLTQNELVDLTIDGAAGKVVKSLEDMGIAVRDTSGVIKSEYLTQIKAMIKADSDMAILTKGDTKRIGELETAWNDFTKVFGEAPGIYDKVREALEKGRFEEYLNENKIQGSAEALEKLVYAANPERIEQFASAWNMTVEAALELAKVMPNLTTATGLMSTTEISEKMSKISAIFSDLSKDGKLTIENFNAILKNYPEYVDQLGDYEALLGSLGKTLTDESLFSYQNALFSSLMSDEGYYKKFMAQLPEDLNKLLTGKNAKTLTDVLNLAQTDEDFADLNDELQKFLDKTYELEVDNPLRDLAIEVREGWLDKQISNLNEQKEALSKINDEHKKELEYIKAKIALEDAQKEKKRIYRAGIGWTFESDETAISEAKEKLESLDIERQQESIQLQIDSLEQQKEILNAIKNNEQLEAIEKALGENGISTKIEDIAAWVTGVKFNPATKQYEEFTKAQEQKRVNAVKKLDELYKSYETAVSTMNSEWSKAGVGRQQELVENVKSAYGKYSEAYTTASGLGADVSGYSENGKIKPNAADSKSWDRAKFIENVAGFKSGDDEVSFTFDGVEYGKVKIAEKKELSGKNHNRLNDIVEEFTGRKDAMVGDLVYLNGHLYIRRKDGHWAVLTDDAAANQVKAKYFLAKGSLSSQSGPTMLNEFGTEGIITPQGTLTALPSKTGVVPADITKNVWALGEVAPTLVASLKSLTQKPISGNAGNTTYEEGQYIDNLTMNVYPTKDYDMDKLLREARAKVNLTRHNN